MPRDAVAKPPFRWKRFLLRGSLIATGMWAVATVSAKYLENDLVFPGETASRAWSEPSDPATQDVWLASADGTKLHAWYLRCEGGEGAILFSHGNGGNLSHRDERIHRLRAAFRRSVLVYDYPGYGKSEGRPTEAGILAAGDAALKWLAEKHPPDRIAFCGESLGGAVAVDLATRHECEGLVLLSTFESLPRAAKCKFPLLPCETLMSNRFESFAKVPNIHVPLFMAHGDADEVIPLEQARRLFDAANEPKRFRVRLGGTHGMAFHPDICAEADAFLAQHRKSATRSAP